MIATGEFPFAPPTAAEGYFAPGTDPLAPTGLEQFESISVPGAVSLTPAPYVPGTLPPMVTRWLRGLMVSNPGQTRLERG